MAIVAPFRGITYNPDKFDNLSELVAPPYDVISEEEQEALYQSHPFNVVRLILGKKKTGDSDWDNRYTRAGDFFRRWESQGILVRAEQPAVYLTSLSYETGNGAPRRTRRGVILLARIEEEGSGVILPHERTFSAHKDDRLRLMRACSAQFSQIFGLYEGRERTILHACEEAVMGTAPLASFECADGTGHQLWAIQDPEVFDTVSRAMADRSIFIADGHHRYETARNFRNIMRARYGRRPDRPYEYVMMYLTNMDDEGLAILPSHRLLKSAPISNLERFLSKLGEWFEIEAVSLPGRLSAEWAAVRKQLEEKGARNTAFAFYHQGADRCYLLSLRPGAREQMGDDLHPSLKQLDVLVLSRFAFQKAMGFRREDLDNDEIFQYESSMPAAAEMVEKGTCRMAFFLNPTRIGQVKEVARNSLVMPRKSTYFYPKILTGLVFNKIDPNESIQLA